MDYVTRQFIVLAKKLRKDVRKSFLSLHSDLSRLADNLKNLKDAITNKWESENHRTQVDHRVTVTDLQTQIPIRVQTEAKRSKIEEFWRYLKGAAELAGIVAVITYTIISYENWQEQIDATNFAGIQAKKARQSLNETIKNFRLDERAWLGLQNSSGTATWTPDGIVKLGNISVNLKNTGKSPALKISGRYIQVTKSVDDPVPDYETELGIIQKRLREKVSQLSKMYPEMASRILRDSKKVDVIPKGGVVAPDSMLVLKIVAGEIQMDRNKPNTVYILEKLTYFDIFKAEHTTKICLELLPIETEFHPCMENNWMD